MRYLKIEPQNKKCLIEYKYYSHQDHAGYRVVETVVWRNGEFLASIAETEDELDELGLSAEDFEGFDGYLESIPTPDADHIDLSDFSVFEYLNTHDEVSSEINVYGSDEKVAKEIQEQLSSEDISSLIDDEVLEFDSSTYSIVDGFIATECDESGDPL